MKQIHKPIEVTQFWDLKTRLAKAEAMIRTNNNSAKIMFEATGQIVPMYDLAQAKRSITKAYNKFYGLNNKYHAIS